MGYFLPVLSRPLTKGEEPSSGPETKLAMVETAKLPAVMYAPQKVWRTGHPLHPFSKLHPIKKIPH
jgi:hypothetical protein